MVECEDILEVVGECLRVVGVAVGDVRNEINQVAEGNDAG
jgi:hypothetical protein